MRIIILLFLLAVMAAGVFMVWPRFEGEPPVLTAPESVLLGVAGAEVEIGWTDSGSGLERLSAVIEWDAGTSGEGSGSKSSPPAELQTQMKSQTLHEANFPGSRLSGPQRPVAEETRSFSLDARALGLADGPATLVVSAQDWSLSGWGSGNRAEQRIPITIDTKPPILSVATGLTYVRRGGAALVNYRTDAESVRSGVRVGEAWFPGLETAKGEYLAVFAVPIEAEGTPVIEVVAIDSFGNETTARFDARLQERAIPEISIGLSSGFLERVAKPLGAANRMTEATPLATFQKVNSELRAQNEAVIKNAIGAPTPPQWSGAFAQMKNSKVTSEFAELRFYTNGGQRVSRARHYGFDLASTARAPITAANGGTVIYAGDNGIYGTLVMIDHGMGITTLYGHLSNLEVAVGQTVVKGTRLGLSGATGLAGGDHLHFAVLVGHTYVDPVEWWDPKWVREHVEARMPVKMAAAGS